MSNPMMRMTAPARNPVGREDATPRYGSGSVNTQIAIGTENVVARQETTAEEILRR